MQTNTERIAELEQQVANLKRAIATLSRWLVRVEKERADG